MIDIRFLRENPDVVRENIKKKFQDEKLPLVDEVIELDNERRTNQQEADELRAHRNKISKEIGGLMAQGKKEEAMALKDEVAKEAKRLEEEKGERCRRCYELRLRRAFEYAKEHGFNYYCTTLLRYRFVNLHNQI